VLSKKITKAKWTGGVAQTVKRLLVKSETLKSKTPVPPKTNKTMFPFHTL
jgi:hypothetical protein